jgi:hypothetical protein
MDYLAGATLSRYPPGTIIVVPFETQFADVANSDYTVAQAGQACRCGET